MALITRSGRTNDDPLVNIFQHNQPSLDTPAAQQALHAGLLSAKREAMHSAERLMFWGRPLLVGIVAVSFLHLWDTIARIHPEYVDPLQLPTWLYHATAAALTLAIDAAALFCVAAGATTALAGATQRHHASLGFFLVTTFLLNAAFFIRYAPAFPEDLRAVILPALEIVFALLIPAIIPVGLFAVESATTRLKAARLKLLVETTALAELVKHAPDSATVPQPTSPTAEAAPPLVPRAAQADRMLPTQPADPTTPVTDVRVMAHGIPSVPPSVADATVDTSTPEPIETPSVAPIATVEAAAPPAPAYQCPNCGTALATSSAYGAAKRWNRCAACKAG